MTLAEWLRENERSGAWLARQLEVSSETVSAWLAGEFAPSRARAERIEQITGGQVQADQIVRARPDGVG